MMIPTTVGSVIASMIPNFLSSIWNFITSTYDRFTTYLEVEKYKGFREPKKIMRKLEDIAENKSEIRIYGQEKSKKQMIEALSGVCCKNR